MRVHQPLNAGQVDQHLSQVMALGEPGVQGPGVGERERDRGEGGGGRVGVGVGGGERGLEKGNGLNLVCTVDPSFLAYSTTTVQL